MKQGTGCCGQGDPTKWVSGLPVGPASGPPLTAEDCATGAAAVTAAAHLPPAAVTSASLHFDPVGVRPCP